jgi:ferredoxin-NADP reductase
MDEAQDLITIVESTGMAASGVRVLTLGRADGGPLPAWSPGAHVAVTLPNGLVRQYSLCGDPKDDQHWRIGVLRERESRGGSQWLHEELEQGTQLAVFGPSNHFRLVEAERYIFIAGGIGITPLLPMIKRVAERGGDWTLTYGGRTADSMAFVDELEAHGTRVAFCPQDTTGLLNLARILGDPRPGVAVYCCGPGPLIDAVEKICEPWSPGSLHVERFQPIDGALDGPHDAFDIVLAQSGDRIRVGADESIVEALERIGVFVPTSCREGTCGTCETVVLAGTPDHRDSVLSSEEREENELMMVCCSRALTPELTLDL